VITGIFDADMLMNKALAGLLARSLLFLHQPSPSLMKILKKICSIILMPLNVEPEEHLGEDI
jgi:hypothetical protein